MSTRARIFCWDAAGLAGWGSPTGTSARESAVGELKSSPVKRSTLGSTFVEVVNWPFVVGAGSNNCVAKLVPDVELKVIFAT